MTESCVTSLALKHALHRVISHGGSGVPLPIGTQSTHQDPPSLKKINLGAYTSYCREFSPIRAAVHHRQISTDNPDSGSLNHSLTQSYSVAHW